MPDRLLGLVGSRLTTNQRLSRILQNHHIFALSTVNGSPLLQPSVFRVLRSYVNQVKPSTHLLSTWSKPLPDKPPYIMSNASQPKATLASDGPQTAAEAKSQTESKECKLTREEFAALFKAAGERTSKMSVEEVMKQNSWSKLKS